MENDERTPDDWAVTVLSAEDFEALCSALEADDDTPNENLVRAVRDTFTSPAFERTNPKDLRERTPEQLEQLERMIAKAKEHPVKLGRVSRPDEG